MTLNAYTDHLPDPKDVLTELPWIEHASGLPAGLATPFLLAYAIEYVETGKTNDYLIDWANNLGVVLVTKYPPGQSPFDVRFPRGITLIARLLTGWVERGDAVSGGLIDFVDLPATKLPTVLYFWPIRAWVFGVLPRTEKQRNPSSKQGGQWAYSLGFMWGNTVEGRDKSAAWFWKTGQGSTFVRSDARQLFFQGVADGQAAPVGSAPTYDAATKAPTEQVVSEPEPKPEETHSEEAETGPLYTYGAAVRSPRYNAVPAGTAAFGAHPLFAQFGTVSYREPLSSEERKHFDLWLIPTSDRLTSLVHDTARAAVESGYPEEIVKDVEAEAYHRADRSLNDFVKSHYIFIEDRPAFWHAVVQYLQTEWGVGKPEPEPEPAPELASEPEPAPARTSPVFVRGLGVYYTNAPPELDLLENATIDTGHGTTRRDEEVRRVAVPVSSAELQVKHYGSQGYFVFSESEWPTVGSVVIQAGSARVPIPPPLSMVEESEPAPALAPEPTKELLSYVGTEWDSTEGKRRVTRIVDTLQGSYLGVFTPGVDTEYLFTPSTLTEEMQRDARILARSRLPAAQKQEKESAPSDSEIPENVAGYLNTLPLLQRTRARDVLTATVGLNNHYDIRWRHIERLVAEGYIVVLGKTFGRALLLPISGAFFAEKDITKTAMDFASYLIQLAKSEAEPEPVAEPPRDLPAPGRPQVDFRPKPTDLPGSYLSVDEKVAHELAIEIQRAADPDYISISREALKSAQDYFNQNGFELTLDRMLELRKKNDEMAVPRRQDDWVGDYPYTAWPEALVEAALPEGWAERQYDKTNDYDLVFYPRKLTERELGHYQDGTEGMANLSLVVYPDTPSGKREFEALVSKIVDPNGLSRSSSYDLRCWLVDFVKGGLAGDSEGLAQLLKGGRLLEGLYVADIGNKSGGEVLAEAVARKLLDNGRIALGLDDLSDIGVADPDGTFEVLIDFLMPSHMQRYSLEELKDLDVYGCHPGTEDSCEAGYEQSVSDAPGSPRGIWWVEGPKSGVLVFDYEHRLWTIARSLDNYMSTQDPKRFRQMSFAEVSGTMQDRWN